MEPIMSGFEKRFICPVPDFSLSMVTLKAGENYTVETTGPEILFVLEGEGTIAGMKAEKGEAFFLKPKENVNAEGSLSFIRAFVP